MMIPGMMIPGTLAIHCTTRNERVVMFKTGHRFGVVILDPEDRVHQLPVFDTADKAREAYWVAINQLWEAAA
jgi:hypothetical protein